MISVQQLRKHYGDFVAVNDISFEIRKGEIVGFLGPNGAGKTTTMRILSGYLNPTSGTVLVGDHNIDNESLEVRRSIGYLPENAPLYPEMKVREFLNFIATLQGVPQSKRSARIKEVAVLCGLSDRLGQDIGHLSKGYRQRVGLAQAMIHDPGILILDEPTSGLDPNQIVEIRSLIKEIGKHKTVILSTHILSEAEATCDRVLIINKGQIVASGTLEELRGGNEAVQIVRVTIGGDGKGVQDLMKTLPGVSRIMKLSFSEQGSVSFEIEFDGVGDPRKQVLQSLVSEGHDVLEVSRESKSLEDVFARLTGKLE